MNRYLGFLLIVPFAIAVAQPPQIKSGATVYIEPINGYETYLAAAIVKKHVPLIVLADKDRADYIIRSTGFNTQPSQPAVVINNNNTIVNNGSNDAWQQSQQRAAARAAARAALGSTSTSISVMDLQSSQILFSYSVGKSGTNHQLQSAAEACAKHLKEFIEKSEKVKK